jgi:type II secretory pathway pseudopilin PulG
MIVVTIVAVLAAIAVPNFLEAQTRARVSRSRAELVTIKMAMEAYRQDERAWPPNRQPGVAGRWDLALLTSPVAYLTQLPMDVFTEPDMRGRRPLGVKPLPYRYLNAAQLEPEKGLTVINNTGLLGGGYIAGVLWGFGPSSVFDDQLKNPSTKIISQAEASLTAYDPSNGTVAYGDIYLRIP